MTAMTFSQALAAIATVEKAWDESKHPRERDGKGGKKDGQFAPGKGAEGRAPTEKFKVGQRVMAYDRMGQNRPGEVVEVSGGKVYVRHATSPGGIPKEYNPKHLRVAAPAARGGAQEMRALSKKLDAARKSLAAMDPSRTDQRIHKIKQQIRAHSEKHGLPLPKNFKPKVQRRTKAEIERERRSLSVQYD